MTKLNHNRPTLRLLDNLRRELAIDSRRTDTLSFEFPEGRPVVANAGPLFLTDDESKVVQRFFCAIERHLEAEFVIFSALAPGCSKAAQRRANQTDRTAVERQLITATKAFVTQSLLSAINGRNSMQRVYETMAETMKKDAYFLWELLNEHVMKKAFKDVTDSLTVDVDASFPKAKAYPKIS